MPGQPDWQRFQSSSGPAMYTALGVSPQLSGTLFAGPWRSFFMSASLPGGNGVWQIQIDYASDAANTNVVYTTKTLVGNGVQRIGWQPIVAQYMTFTVTRLVGAVGTTIKLNVVPSLLDAPQASRIITTPLTQVFEGQLAAGATGFLIATYSMPGPAVLTVRSNLAEMVYDLMVMDNTGTFNPVIRYQVPFVNQLYQYNIQLPDSPVWIRTFNSGDVALSTFDIVLAPA